MPKPDPQLESTMAASMKAYENASPKWFDYLATDATVYSVGATEPYKGQAAYKSHFEGQLTSTKRKAKVIHQSVQPMGERAVVAQTLQITQEGVIFNVRQSVVWDHSQAGWKISHLHTALVGNPVSAKDMPTKGARIQVLNEKIATTAAVCGVAQ